MILAKEPGCELVLVDSSSLEWTDEFDGLF